MPKAESCVFNNRVITIEQALDLRSEGIAPSFTCIECGEPVRVHKAGTTGQGAHFEHREKNPRCSLSDAHRQR
jgi:hypothetical protein